MFPGRLSVLLLVLGPAVDAVVVSTSYGRLLGAEVVGPQGQRIYAFKKIPFAAPPVGSLRFAPPKPPQKWSGVRDSREYGPACMSNSSVTTSPQEWVDEDCLHVNVFTSQACFEDKSGCPVVFYLHGGGLEYDSAVMFNDSKLIETFASKDVVLVVTAFRLGIFSHVIFADEDVLPHNIAIYDIFASLQFVNKEIHNFGGSNTKVTLFGHSFGAGIAAALIFGDVDPEKKLFQRVASMSGSIRFEPLQSKVDITWKFIRYANCSPPDGSAEDFRQIYSLMCLRSLDQHTLLRTQRRLEDEGFKEFGGVVLGAPFFSGKNNTDFRSHPRKVDLMLGTTLNEMDTHTLDPGYDVGKILEFENPMEVDAKYKKELENGQIGGHALNTQVLFVETHRHAQLVAKTGADVYLYRYVYPKHADHTDDLYYLMGVHKFDMDENEQVLSRIYPQYFINFIKGGAPDRDWKKFDAELDDYFLIDVNVTTGLMPKMATGYEVQIVSYWDDEMRKFDAEVSKRGRKQFRELPVGVAAGIRQPWSLHFTTACFILAVFLLGIVVGFCTCGRPPQVVVAPLPNEKTPLNQQFI